MTEECICHILSHCVQHCHTCHALSCRRIGFEASWQISHTFWNIFAQTCPTKNDCISWRLNAFLVSFFLDIFCTFFSDGAGHISYFHFYSFPDQGHLRHMMDMKLSLLLRPEILLTLFSFLSENLTPTNISAVSLLWLFFARYQCWYLYCIVFVLTPGLVFS